MCHFLTTGAMLAYGRGDAGEAIAWVNAAVAAGGGATGDVLHLGAVAKHALGLFSSAVADYDVIVRADPNSMAWYARRAPAGAYP